MGIDEVSLVQVENHRAKVASFDAELRAVAVRVPAFHRLQRPGFERETSRTSIWANCTAA